MPIAARLTGWLGTLVFSGSFSNFAYGQTAAEPPAAAPAASIQPTMSASKSARADTTVFAPSSIYGSVELRHHINTYYEQGGYLSRKEPSAHARVQIGSIFYGGLLDAYATLGVYKLPSTQQVLQRRPEAALDLYPIRHANFTLLQYNLVQLPFKQLDANDSSAEAQPEISTDDEKASDTSDTVDGTIYTVGLAPTLKLPLAIGASTLELKTGLDVWTRLYSRRQYATHYEHEDDQEHGGHFGLNADDEEPIEDYALHYQTQYLGGFLWRAGFLPGFSSEVMVNHNSRFDPIYKRLDDQSIEYRYGANRYSYYRMRLQYDFTPRLSLINDFYHFHDGFFAAQREGDERRFRNIARITCRL